MITQNILMEMVSGQAISNTANKRTKNTGDKYSSDFRDVFKESISKSDSKSNLKNSTEKPISTFKQVSKNRSLSVKNQDKTCNSKNTERDSAGIEAEDALKVREKSVLNGIAELMGISNDELINLMSVIGINPSDLCNTETASKALSELSDVLGLNAEQSQDFMLTVKEINLLIDSALEQSAIKGNISGKEGWVKVQGVNIEVKNNTKPDLRELASELDSKIHELVNSIKSGEGSTFDDVIQKIKQLTQNVSLQKGIGDAGSKSENMNYEQTKDDKGDRSNNDAENNSISKTTSIIKQSPSESIKPQGSLNSNDHDTAIFNNINISEASKASDLNKPERISSEIRTVRNAIMSQVVEKAKVMLDGHKSEMIMELKPESLGKLSLKVVTESGIVMAKFVAENQQVKEIIESNMQLLKDSLENQGLSVQGFSVSVGQDSEKGHSGQWNMNRGKNAELIGRDSVETVLNIPFSDSMTNPYESNESSVDFRA